jgi:GntP family gluconate:H+ symporter
MSPTAVTLGVLLLGILVVVAGVLALRLHAFLALILGALVVAVLTPSAAVQRVAVKKAALTIAEVHVAQDRIVVASGADQVPPGMLFAVVRENRETGRFDEVTSIRTHRKEPLASSEERSVPLTSLFTTPGDALRPIELGDLLLPPATLAAANRESRSTIGARVAKGFGDTCVSIGILIAMAAIIGACLLESGAADRIVRTVLRWFGEAGAPAAFVLSGFVLGIPVFFDTVFYLMIPLGKAMHVRTGHSYLLYVLTIVCGATMAHSLVPPTPGPLFVAEALDVNLATMMIGGTVVGLFTSLVGYSYARFINRLCVLPLRDLGGSALAELPDRLERSEQEMPPFWLSLVPILLPVVLITLDTLVSEGLLGVTVPESVRKLVSTLGEKNLALTIAAVVSMYLLVRYRKASFQQLADSSQAALSSAGTVILITAAGGAFGAALAQTDVAGLVQDLPASSPVMLCTFAWLITVAIRTAQGSATVAMITAVGILTGVAESGELGVHPLYLALAIGSGSKPVAWMNDSGFWVITRMSGMTEMEGLKYVTPMTSLMGASGLVAVLVGVTLFPMI